MASEISYPGKSRGWPQQLREAWRKRFGMWWWIRFSNGTLVGPMRYRRAHRWAADALIPYNVIWSRGTPK